MSIELNVPFDTYSAWPGVHSGQINSMARSMLHAHYYEKHGKQDTPALEFGRNSHFACLQPDLWRSLMVEALELDRRSNANKAAHAEFEAANRGKIVIPRADAQAIEAMVASVWSHPGAHQLLATASGIEVSTRWTDYETSLPCKCRLDIVGDGGHIADLKTTLNAAYYPFQRSILSYGYHRQAAWYARGYRLATGYTGEVTFHFIAVEKQPPYAVAVYDLFNDSLDLIDRQNQRLLRTWADCEATDRYPGYHHTSTPLILPEWALGDADNDITITLNGEHFDG